MPTEASALGLSHTLLMVFQHAVASFLSSIRLRPDIHVANTTNITLNEHGVPGTASCHIIRPVTEIGIPQGSVDVRTQTVDNQQYAITRREPVGTPEPPAQTYNSSFAFESDDFEEDRQPTRGGEHVSNGASPPRSNRTRTWMVMLIVGILSLIVLPGLTLGIVTRQIPVGIALSGAIATVASLLAGLYYYHNK